MNEFIKIIHVPRKIHSKEHVVHNYATRITQTKSMMKDRENREIFIEPLPESCEMGLCEILV